MQNEQITALVNGKTYVQFKCKVDSIRTLKGLETAIKKFDAIRHGVQSWSDENPNIELWHILVHEENALAFSKAI